MNIIKRQRLSSLSWVLIILLLGACTKERTPFFQDGATDDLFAITEIENAKISLTTLGNSNLSDLGLTSNSFTDSMPVVKAEAKNVPENFKPMFDNLSIVGKTDSNYDVKLKVDAHTITAYKVVADLSQASIVEKSIAESDGNTVLIPLFQYAISTFGTPIQVKNDLGEKTSVLRLKETKKEEATHIRASILPDHRKMVAYDSSELEHLHSISALKDAEIVLTDGGASSMASEIAKQSIDPTMRADLEMRDTNAAIESAPKRLSRAFEGLAVQKSHTGQKMVFNVSKSYLTAFRLTDSSSLSVTEKQIALPLKNKGGTGVPMFQYKIEQFGKLERERNSDGSRGSKIVLRPVAFEGAEFVQIDLLSSKRVDVRPSLDLNQSQMIFLKEKIVGTLLNASQIKRNFDLTIMENDSVLYLTALDKNKMSLLKVLDFQDLDEKSKSIILAGDKGGAKLKRLYRCDDAILQQIAEPIRTKIRPSCVVQLAYEFGVEGVVAERKIETNDGSLSSEVSFTKAAPGTDASLIRVMRKTELKAIASAESNSDLIDPNRMLSSEWVKGKEFLFRRTVVDGPSVIQVNPTGFGSDLALVTFEFRANSVRVVSADATIKNKTSNELDKFTIMSLPATYVKSVQNDPEGRDYIPTSFDDQKAIAIVEWTENQIPDSNGALSIYGNGTCFLGSDRPIVSNVDLKLESGLIGFTLNTTRPISPECLDQVTGQRNGEQTTFSFQERFSFKRYVAEGSDETKVPYPEAAIPVKAQKELGFALFTSQIQVPNNRSDSAGNWIQDQKFMPNLVDIRDEKVVIYHLMGLPKGDTLRNQIIREKIIQATKEVFDDWNKAFKQATGKEKALEIVIDDEKSNGTFGDLDKNAIYYVHKSLSSGILGLGGPNVNPRTGMNENAAVIMYGGNLLSYVQDLRLLDKLRLQFDKSHGVIAPKKLKVEPRAMMPEGTPRTASSGNGIEKDGDAEKVMKSIQFKNGVPAAKLQNSLFETLKKRGNAPEMDSVISAALQGNSAKQAALIAKANAEAKSKGYTSDTALYSAFMTKRLSEEGSEFGQAEEVAEANSLFEREKQKQAIRSGLLSKRQCALEAPGLLAGSDALNTEKEAKSCEKKFDLTKDQDAFDTCLDIEVLAKLYKTTLAHEMGHNFGLRHNFIGSMDSPNFLHDPEEKSKRSYSSVMDYLSTKDELSYDGLGPYDVAAIRVAYTGMLEISTEAIAVAGGALEGLPVIKRFRELNGGKSLIDSSEFLKNKVSAEADGSLVITTASGIKLPVINGNLVKISDYLNAVKSPDKSIMDLDQNKIAQLPPRFRFCTDEDTLTNVLCKRYDTGVLPHEIINEDFKSYLSNYQHLNFPGNRFESVWYKKGSYQTNVFRKLEGLRAFMEEALFRIAGGSTLDIKIKNQIDQVYLNLDRMAQAVAKKEGKDPSELGYQGYTFEFGSVIQAGYDARQYLESIVRTPDVPNGIDESRRFTTYNVKVQTSEDPNAEPEIYQVPVERKFLSDSADFVSHRLNHRGIQFDKIISLLMLTDRDMHSIRTLMMGVQFSFADFDRLINDNFETTKKENKDLPTLKLLGEIIAGNVAPAAYTDIGSLDPNRGKIDYLNKSKFEVSINLELKSAALIFSIQNLDSGNPSADANFAKLFKVLNGRKVPEGVTEFIVATDQVASDPTSIKLWAEPGSKVALDMIRRYNKLSAIKKLGELKKDSLQGLLKAHLLSTYLLDETAKKAASDDLAKFTSELQAEVDKLPLTDKEKTTALTDALSTIGLLANFGSIQKLTLEALTKAGASSADILEFKNKMELTLKTVFDGDDTVHLLLTTVLESTLEDGSTLDPLLAVKKALEKDKDASSALEGLGFVLEQLDPKSKSTEMQIMYANLYQLSKFYVQSHPGDPTF